MFTGIVEAIGTVQYLHDGTMTIYTPIYFDDLKIGDSIAVNGVCLTVTDFEKNHFTVSAVPETLRLTNLSLLKLDSLVNLERSLSFNGRVGGHFVQGHVDGTGEILEINQDGDSALLVKIKIPTQLAQYIVRKGYITVDGMSITVIEATDDWFTVTFIPHTQAVTIVKNYKMGSKVNLEVDILGKYIEKLIGGTTHAIMS